jgi:hypothetical protein
MRNFAFNKWKMALEVEQNINDAVIGKADNVVHPTLNKYANWIAQMVGVERELDFADINKLIDEYELFLFLLCDRFLFYFIFIFISICILEFVPVLVLFLEMGMVLVLESVSILESCDTVLPDDFMLCWFILLNLTFA